MSEIEKLCNKSYEKLNSSKALYELGNYSDSASLAYYSMFLMAKALLNKKGFDAKTHNGLISSFSFHYVYNGKFDPKIYASLAAGQSIREDADYSVADYITQEIAEEFLVEAEKFL